MDEQELQRRVDLLLTAEGSTDGTLAVRCRHDPDDLACRWATAGMWKADLERAGRTEVDLWWAGVVGIGKTADAARVALWTELVLWIDGRLGLTAKAEAKLVATLAQEREHMRGLERMAMAARDAFRSAPPLTEQREAGPASGRRTG